MKILLITFIILIFISCNNQNWDQQSCPKQGDIISFRNSVVYAINCKHKDKFYFKTIAIEPKTVFVYEWQSINGQLNITRKTRYFTESKLPVHNKLLEIDLKISDKAKYSKHHEDISYIYYDKQMAYKRVLNTDKNKPYYKIYYYDKGKEIEMNKENISSINSKIPYPEALKIFQNYDKRVSNTFYPEVQVALEVKWNTIQNKILSVFLSE